MIEDIKFTKGTVSEKSENSSENPRAPKGFIYLVNDERKFTIWDEESFNNVFSGGMIKIGYTETENLYSGTKYINFNVKSIEDLSMGINPKKINFTKKEIEELEEIGQDTSKLNTGEGNIGFCILGHKLIVEEVKDIKVPRKVLDYLIEKKLDDGKK